MTKKNSKRNSKNRVRKLDVTDVEQAIQDESLQKKIKEKLAKEKKKNPLAAAGGKLTGNSLFTIDTKGNKDGLGEALSAAAKKELARKKLREMHEGGLVEDLENDGSSSVRGSKKSGKQIVSSTTKNGKPLTQLQLLRQRKLSSFEQAKIDKRAKTDENYAKDEQEKKVYQRKSMFDLWGGDVVGVETVKEKKKKEEVNAAKKESEESKKKESSMIDERDMGAQGTTFRDRAFPVKKDEAADVEVKTPKNINEIMGRDIKKELGMVERKGGNKDDKSKETKSVFKVSKTTHDLTLKNKVSILNTQPILRPRSVPSTVGTKENVSNCPAVMLPESGLSINPGKKAMEKTVNKVFLHELKDMESEEELNRRMRPMTSALLEKFSKEELRGMTDREKVREYLKMSRGGELEPAGGKEIEPRLPHQVKQKLTKTQRNKLNRAKSNVEKENSVRKMKSLDKSIGQAPNLLRELEKEDAAREEQKRLLKQLRQERDADPETAKRARMGRGVFDEGPKVLPTKSSSGLRNAQIGQGIVVKEKANKNSASTASSHSALSSKSNLASKGVAAGSGIGSALMDRVHSLQRRNMVELPTIHGVEGLRRVRKKGKQEKRGKSFRQQRLKGRPGMGMEE